ncbi:esterase/lipase family protein [Chengkuizengella sediminis]|uniref:esterase/lipase family protein n=1 Tax=Chengkuizengella sediminis TaxID=1885917 RepID=UPI001F10AAA7|nr:lipase [Chengkuizengella sediminis]
MNFSKMFYLSLIVIVCFVSPFIFFVSPYNVSAQESLSLYNSNSNNNLNLMDQLSDQAPISQNLLADDFSVERVNHDPIILVHGLVGWGRDEFLGFRYWGGLVDIEEDLKDYGYETYTAAVGPFSSNWDRACELYAQIKGGTVDYGEAHSAQHGHEQYGRTFTGFLPEWGEINPDTGIQNKVHLVGHSLGGQTIRVLIQLLEEGDMQERELTDPDQLSPLFNNGQTSWINSVLTISSPHDGTTTTRFIDGFFPMTKDFIALAASLSGKKDNIFYDFKLDQWGLKRAPGESWESYAERVYNSSIWDDTKDTAEWDVSPEGASELNSWVLAQPDTYYFSVSSEQTYPSIWTGYHKPELFMNPIFYLTGGFLGKYTESGEFDIDSDWWKNDGVVNTNSMDGPTLDSSDEIINYNGVPEKGKWNYLGEFTSTDHIDVIGIGFYEVRDWYRSIADLLGSLK